MRSWILSAVLLTAAAAVGQPPKPPAPKPPTPGGVDEAVLNALRTHPDIKLAEAKVRMAEAEVEQTKSRVAQRITGAFAKLEQAKAELVLAQDYLDRIKKAGGSTTELLSATAQYQRVKSAVVDAEVELNAAQGAAPRVQFAPADPDQAAVDRGLKWLARMQETGVAPVKPVPAGTVADRMKTLLDKPVMLDLTGADLDAAVAAVLKSVGDTTLTVKLPTLGRRHLKDPPTVTAKGEMTFAAAMQLILDEINRPENGAVFESLKGQQEVYVREYGLLVTRVQDAPKDAPTLAEFARQVRAEKGGKK